MPNLFLEKTVEISAPSSKVWCILTDPKLSRALGGEYVSDWEVGSSIVWKDLKGTALVSGKILRIEPEHLLKHNTLRDADGVQSLYSVITYELRWQGEKTTLLGRESFAEDCGDKAFADAANELTGRLNDMKLAAEKAA